MLNKNLPVVVNMKRAVRTSFDKAQKFSQNTWVRVVFLSAFLAVIYQKDFSFQISIGAQESAAGLAETVEHKATPPKAQPASFSESIKPGKAKTVAQHKKWWEYARDISKDVRKELNLANAATAVGEGLSAKQQEEAAKYSNLGFVLSPNYAKKHNISPTIVQYKKQVCLDYIHRYASTAQEEAELFGIPASITLAQGLLESNAGDSRLAKQDNNHFGIKCRKKCLGCRCANYTDDSRYDMFRIFESDWMSFREHSKLLSGKRYKHLKKLKRTDYKNWAHGLKAAGYATDKRYAYKLIGIIEAFELDKYDR